MMKDALLKTYIQDFEDEIEALNSQRYVDVVMRRLLCCQYSCDQ